MNDTRDFDRAVDRWLDDGWDTTRPEIIDAVLLAARSTPQERGFRVSWRPSPTKRLPYAVTACAALVISVTALAVLGPRFGAGPGSMPSAVPSPGLGIFEPVAGRIVYGMGGSVTGVWAVNPTAPTDRAPVRQIASNAIPLGWSSDGTRLLLLRSSRDEPLSILHADGTETQVPTGRMAIRAATISPDGSRVVFKGESGQPSGGAAGDCCARSGLYAVDVDGGPVVLLLESRDGILEAPTFSPDGTQIAYTDGGGDHSNNVWVVDVDGTDAHQIVSNEWTDGAGHVHGLAWSPSGGRIALGLEGTTYTFATDGSAFTQVITNGERPYWSPDGSRLAYTMTCLEYPDGCGLGIANADGSNVVTSPEDRSGPWHPGLLENDGGGR